MTIASGVVAGGFYLAANIVSDRFFRRLIAQHPELADAFPPPSPNTQYGPILPSKMAYLKKKRFEELSDPALRQLGLISFRVLTACFVSFTGFLLCVLWWKVNQQLS
ncbi:hypothetical protein [Pinirhizobacter soli]|uniref:hypothetical protein n=1 Tax=Pinirhizobacter soli TaxID=2786953 RepID=UPI002029B80D|nr:hypothetical protein [Pinirhizobacter soli]